MNETKSTEPQSAAGAAAQTHLGEERRAAEGLAHDAKAAATEAGTQAKQMASDKAEELQGAAASHLSTFADAVRTAGDELAEKDPGPASDLVRQAATGLEELSGAMSRKSASDMIAGVRDFGRQNPVGFLAGSMLAGFALARFASSSSTHSASSSAQASPRSHATAVGLGDGTSGDQANADRSGFRSSERHDASGPQSGGHSAAGVGQSGMSHATPFGDDQTPFGDDRPRNPVPDSKGRTDI